MLKTYNFWVKLIAVSILIFKVVGEKFGFYVDSVMFMDIATILASILVVLGVLQVPASSGDSKTKTKKETSEVKEDITKVLIEMGEKIKQVAGGTITSKVSMLVSLIDEIVSENGENIEKNGENIEKNEQMAIETENLSESSLEENDILVEDSEVVKSVENDAEVQTVGGTDTVIIEEELSEEESKRIEEFLATNLSEAKIEKENNLSQVEGEGIMKEDATVKDVQPAGVTTGQESYKSEDAIKGPSVASETTANEKSSLELETIIKEKIKEIIENNLGDILSSIS